MPEDTQPEDETEIAAAWRGLPVAALVIGRDLQVLQATPAFCRAFDIPDPVAVRGQGIGEAIACPEARAAGRCGGLPSCRDCVLNKRARLAVETQTHEPIGHAEIDAGRLPSGKHYRVEVNPVSGEGESQAVLVFHDVTRSRHVWTLERIFIHDLANLSSVLAACVHLLDGENGDGRVAALERLQEVSATLSGEIARHRDLVGAARGELRVSPEPADVGVLLRQVIHAHQDLAAAHGKRIQLRGELPALVMETDAGLLQRVLGNLVKNALEAVPRGGTVHLTADVSPTDLEIRVENPGVIHEGVAPGLFRQERSTKGVGRGLGLVSVRILTEMYLRGRVHVESTDAKGTRFSVRLPLATQACTAVARD